MLQSSKDKDKDSEGAISSSIQLANNEWVVPPLHHNGIKAVQSQYMVFGETVQLMKLWLAKHNFSGEYN
jgi:hypothetical protein